MASLLLCAAAALAVQQLTPAAAVTVSIPAAARDLPAGHVLAAGDITTMPIAPSAVPDGTLAVAGSWPGRQLSGPLRRGEPLTDASLMGDGLLVGAPPGSQAVPVRLADAGTVRLIRQGQLVNVVLSSTTGLDGPTTDRVLAEAVPVLWTPANGGSAAPGLLPARDVDGLVVVAALPDQALRLAGASARGKVFLVLVGSG